MKNINPLFWVGITGLIISGTLDLISLIEGGWITANYATWLALFVVGLALTLKKKKETDAKK